MYLRLYHGRKDPDETMDDWGTDGPMIGNVGIGWTYGALKLHGDDDFISLPLHGDMILFDGCYYGDFEVIEKYDFRKDWNEYRNKVISFEKAKQLIENR
jgi:hypothetical protein